MWTRAELKEKAKSVLKTSYWYGVVAILVYIGIAFAGSLIVSELVPYLSVVVSIFLTMPLAVGLYYFFMNSRSNAKEPQISNVFYSFKGNRYLKIVGSMAWMLLFTFLWMIIPVAGIVLVIIKGISYSMNGFILTDNPNIGYRRALKLSMAMTDGHKGAIFVLGLSFIGWGILATIPVGLGWIFLYPYMMATYSELYAKLRENALNNGICTYEELGMSKVL